MQGKDGDKIEEGRRRSRRKRKSREIGREEACRGRFRVRRKRKGIHGPRIGGIVRKEEEKKEYRKWDLQRREGEEGVLGELKGKKREIVNEVEDTVSSHVMEKYLALL